MKMFFFSKNVCKAKNVFFYMQKNAKELIKFPKIKTQTPDKQRFKKFVDLKSFPKRTISYS